MKEITYVTKDLTFLWSIANPAYIEIYRNPTEMSYFISMKQFKEMISLFGDITND